MILENYKNACNTPSDINEHLPALKDLATECDHVTEMGVRSVVSTWAFMAGLRATNSKLVSIDIEHPSKYGVDLEAITVGAKLEGVNFSFLLGDTLKLNIEETDLLFIDTLHFAEQLEKELELHASKVRKYIAFHDTTSSAEELVPVINKFLSEHPEWQVHKVYTNNNGLTILKHGDI